MVRGSLSKVDRIASAVLALVFLGAGGVGIVMGAGRSHFLLLAVSVLAACWGVAWAVVAWRGRLLGRRTSPDGRPRR